jgi:hypothetical protein
MKAIDCMDKVSDADALQFVADLLPWWRRRGEPEQRARARRAQEIIERLRRAAGTDLPKAVNASDETRKGTHVEPRNETAGDRTPEADAALSTNNTREEVA